MSEQHLTIGLVGNPNCGKTTLFNALTGSKQKVGNWPGVTVERKSGSYQLNGTTVEVVDLPGTYSLDVVEGEVSLDEQVARDYVHAHEAQLIVNILDASKLERNLYLTSQLAEMGLPLLVVLNMVDMAEAKGMKLDPKVLSQRLGCPVLPVVAAQGIGVAELKEAIISAAHKSQPTHLFLEYDSSLELAVQALELSLRKAGDFGVSPRWLALRLLEGDDLAKRTAGPELSAQAGRLAETLGGDVDILVADARYGLANSIWTTDLARATRVAEALVAGNSVFGAADPAEAIRAMSAIGA